MSDNTIEIKRVDAEILQHNLSHLSKLLQVLYIEFGNYEFFNATQAVEDSKEVLDNALKQKLID